MTKKVKGITLEIGGDTAGLTKALSEVNKKTRNIQSELREVDKALKLNPKNVDLLSQKQKLLTDNIENTKTKLSALKKAKESTDKAMADGTEVNAEQYRRLQREISNTQQALKKMESHSKDTGKALKSAGNSEINFKKLGSTLSAAAKGAGVFAGAVVGVAAALSQAEEESREYREDLNKLKAGFLAADKTVESAKKTYSGFYNILGESDRAVEAANHLAKLTNNEKELSKWTEIAAGVNATFTDSLPLEGLTEASNETAKVGKVTGVLADALNWAGVNEDAFNESLAKCSSEQERSALITETLHGIYSETGKQYMEMNSSVIANREAQQKWNDTMARVGELVAPAKAQLAEWGASLLENLVNIIDVKDETTELTNRINDQNESWRNLIETQKEKLEADLGEIDYTKRLYNELKRLTDENGNVHEKNKVRAEFILDELNEALGLELELVGLQVQGYKNLGISIDEMLAKKRAEIILAGQEESYKKAIQEIDKKEIEQAELKIKIREKEQKLAELQAAFAKTQNRDTAVAMGNIRTQISSLKGTYEDNAATISEYYQSIYNYETGMAALLEGNYEKIKEITAGTAESYSKTGKEKEQALLHEMQVAREVLENRKKLFKNGEGNITQAQIDEAQERYDQLYAEWYALGTHVMEGYDKGLLGGRGPVMKTTQKIIDDNKFLWTTGFNINSPSKWAEDIGEYIDEGLANGLLNNLGMVRKTFKEVFNAAEEEHEDLTAEEEKYNKELEKIRAEGTEEANKDYLENLKKLAENAKEQRKIIRDTYEGMVDDVRKAIDSLDSEMQSYKDGLSDVELTTEITRKFVNADGEEEFTVSGGYGLADLSGKRKELEDFKNDLLNLKNIGIDEAMLEQIKKLGGEKGGQLAEALLHATPEQREAFINDFKAIGELAGETTAEVFQSEIEGVTTNIKNLFGELNPDLLKIGEDWGTVLGQGILAKLKTTLTSMKDVVSVSGYGGTVSSNGGGSVGASSSGSGSVIVNNNVTQNIGTATPETAYEAGEEVRKETDRVFRWAVLS